MSQRRNIAENALRVYANHWLPDPDKLLSDIEGFLDEHISDIQFIFNEIVVALQRARVLQQNFSENAFIEFSELRDLLSFTWMGAQTLITADLDPLRESVQEANVTLQQYFDFINEPIPIEIMDKLVDVESRIDFWTTFVRGSLNVLMIPVENILNEQ